MQTIYTPLSMLYIFNGIIFLTLLCVVLVIFRKIMGVLQVLGFYKIYIHHWKII